MSEENVLLGQQSSVAVEEQVRICKKCGEILKENQKFCTVCGTAYEEPVVEAPTFCTNCGKEIPSDFGFCPFCGQKKASAAAVAAAEPVKPEKKKKKGLIALLVGGGALLAVGCVVVIILAIILAFVFRTVPVESIELSDTAIELVEEESVNISCDVYPENATDKTVVWESSNEKVATVDQYGRITAVASGTCEITAIAGEVTESLDVTVKKKLPDLQAIYDEYCESTWASLGNDHSYLSVDTNPYNYDDGDYRYIFEVNGAIEDINKALGLPDSLYEDMNQTSWSMGKQEEVFENIGLKVTWTYHPDKGLEVTYKLILD